MYQYWTDVYLSWNPENYPGVQNLRFPSDQVWTPDILLYNRSELLSKTRQEQQYFVTMYHNNVLKHGKKCLNFNAGSQYLPLAHSYHEWFLHTGIYQDCLR